MRVGPTSSTVRTRRVSNPLGSPDLRSWASVRGWWSASARGSPPGFRGYHPSPGREDHLRHHSSLPPLVKGEFIPWTGVRREGLPVSLPVRGTRLTPRRRGVIGALSLAGKGGTACLAPPACGEGLRERSHPQEGEGHPTLKGSLSHGPESGHLTGVGSLPHNTRV